MAELPELPKRLSKDTVQADAPAAGFFLLGVGGGVWLTLVSHPVALGAGSGALVVGVLVLTSRYLGFPIRALRPKGAEPPIQADQVEIKDLHLHDLHLHLDGGPIANAIGAAMAGDSASGLAWPDAPTPDPSQRELPLGEADEGHSERA
jgi:hypothetical protein